MTTIDPDRLTRLIVNMTDRSMASLDYAAANLGLSQTDTVNRALQVYAALLATERGADILIDRPEASGFLRFVRHDDVDGAEEGR